MYFRDMSNNRLFVLDEETGDILLLAKGWGDGWHLAPDADLEGFLRARDFAASCDAGATTKLRLVTENEPWRTEWVLWKRDE